MRADARPLRPFALLSPYGGERRPHLSPGSPVAPDSRFRTCLVRTTYLTNRRRRLEAGAPVVCLCRHRFAPQNVRHRATADHSSDCVGPYHRRVCRSPSEKGTAHHQRCVARVVDRVDSLPHPRGILYGVRALCLGPLACHCNCSIRSGPYRRRPCLCP